jgi:ubiquinone/menaquinone biosynthesis C-methylase UbiE
VAAASTLTLNKLPEENSFGVVKRIHVVRQWIENLRRGRPSLRILDYGCGTGELLTCWLGNPNDEIVGVDFHDQTIQYANDRNPRPEIRYRLSDLDSLRSEERLFDVAVCSEVLEHIHEPLDFLRKMRQVLQPDGVLIITTPNGYGAYELLASVQKVMHRIGLSKQNAQADATSGFLNIDSGHVQFFTVRQLMSLFRESNFTVAGRRARSLLCGPYVDPLFNILPLRQTIFSLNNRAADLLPFSFAADWMFLLKRT